MRAGGRIAVGALAASVAAGHLLYPALLSVVADRRARPPVRPTAAEWPRVTVVVPAYLESGIIARKIRNIEANGYPGEVTVLVVSDGDPESARAAADAGAEVLELAARGGKAQALNAGVAAADSEWIVLTDANAELVPGSLANLVSWLRDPTVGAVAGEKLEGEGGELAYWKFTSWIKRNEWRLGSTIALDGGLCAVRRSAWSDIPADISCDDFWISLDMTDRGYRVAYEPAAAVLEEAIGSFSRSWERRTRVLGSSLWVLWRKKHLLVRSRDGVAAKIWGHKLWRSTVGPLSHGALLVVAATSARRSPVAMSFLLANAAAAGLVGLQARDVVLPKPLSIPAQIMYLQAVAVGGLWRFARGDRAVKWKKPAR